MSFTVLTDIDLTLNQLLEAVLENLATDPTGVNLVSGRIWYNTATNQIKYYNGTVVKVINGATKFASTIGDGTSTSFAVVHNLNTEDVLVQVYTTASPISAVQETVVITDANTVTVSFKRAPAVNAYRVVIVG